MNKKNFRKILDYLFGEIEGIDINKIIYNNYYYQSVIEIVENHLIKEEVILKDLFPEYDILTMRSELDFMLSKLSSVTNIYTEIDESLLYHDLLLNKDMIEKIIYHKILKDKRKYKIESILKDL